MIGGGLVRHGEQGRFGGVASRLIGQSGAGSVSGVSRFIGIDQGGFSEL